MPESVPYAIDALGWVQLERLCDEVLRLEGVEPEWVGRADVGRYATAGSAALAVVWVRPTVRAQLARTRLIEQIATTLGRETNGRSLRLFTNLDLSADDVDAVNAAAGYVGPRQLSAAIDREPRLRRRVPSVLGVRDLGELVRTDVVASSTGDIAAARQLARVFVPTRAYERALDTLERHRFAVLTGPPEMGKTAIARMIALALLTEAWEFHECVRPDELWTQFSPGRAQVFVADDAFGSTEYRPEAAERWALELDRVLHAMDERHWLIWTSRPAPLKAALRRVHREHGVERWPQPAEVHVAADALDVEEKALILFRHTSAAGVEASTMQIVRRHGWRIVSHAHFTPERIRRFVARLSEGAQLDERRLRTAIEHEIREPTEAMAASLRALPLEHRMLLVALLDVPPGPVPERELASAVRRHLDAGMPKSAAELVDRLTDHFLRLVPPTSVAWVHPSWRDLVIDDLGGDATARRRFLARSSLHGVLLALSTGGGATGERQFPLLREDTDWDRLADRQRALLHELAGGDLARLLTALAEALRAGAEPRVACELQALAAETLDVLRRRWDAHDTVIPPPVLESWLDVRALLDDPPPPPDVTATWHELLPRTAPRVHDVQELHAFDDWLRLATTLRGGLPDIARGLGFPQEQAELFDSLLYGARLAADRHPRPPTAGLLAHVLVRAGEAAPEIAGAAGGLARLLAPATPEAFAATRSPPRTSRSAATDVVDRILRDL